MTNSQISQISVQDFLDSFMVAWKNTQPFGDVEMGDWCAKFLGTPSCLLVGRPGTKGCLSCTVQKGGFVVKLYKSSTPEDISTAGFINPTFEWYMTTLAPGWALPFVGLLELPLCYGGHTGVPP